MAAKDQAYVYVGLGTEGGPEGHGLYRRVLGGDSWELSVKGLPKDPTLRNIAIDPSNPAVLYAGAQDGLYRSDDHGARWERVDLPGGPAMVWSVNFQPGNSKVIYVGGEDAKLFRSTNGGKDWDTIPIHVTYPSVTMAPRVLPKRLLNVSVDPSNSEEIYAAIEVGGLIRSYDGGESWENVSEGQYQNDDPVDLHGVLVSSAKPRNIFIIARIGMYRSEDGGDHWSWGGLEYMGPTGTYSRVIREHPGDPSTIYIGGGPEFRGEVGALFRSKDYGRTWKKVEMGVIPDSTIFGFSINPRNPQQMYAATRAGQVLGSHDGGQSWKDYSLPNGVREVNALAVG
jgi:photosystem II stability/assembly factor-like uncharacterized protein